MKISQLFERKPNPSQQPRRCCHQHPDGTGCSAHPQRDSQYCFFHNPDPAQEAQRRQASSTGGRASTHPPLLPPDLPVLSLKTASDVASLLEETTNQVRRGEIELRAATTICYIANSLLHALEVNARAEREAVKAEHRAATPVPSRKKHPAPLNLTMYDHTGRIIDQIPPDATPAPFPGTISLRTASSNTPTPSPEQGMSPPRGDADQRRFVQDPSTAPLLATGSRQLGTVSKSNTPSPTPSPEQGMNPERTPDAREQSTRAKQRSAAERLDNDLSENALHQHGRSQDLRGSSTRASALAQNDTQKNPSGKPDPSAPPLRTENRELRTAVQYPPGLGPRHLGPGPGGSLMAGTPPVPWWRRRQRINPHYITGMARQTAEILADDARSKRTPR